MLKRALILSASLLCLAQMVKAETAQVHDLGSWTLRFTDKRSIRLATTGCYGTASYNYFLPSVEYVKAYRMTLKDKAAAENLSGFVFTNEVDGARNPVVVDLDSGATSTVSGIGVDAGVVFCLCRSDLTQARSPDGQPNCSASNVPPLGHTFFAAKDGADGPTNPEPRDTWTDPVTNWVWTFASVAADWNEAKTLCDDGDLPSIAVLAHASHRIWDSGLGIRIRNADARRVWSSEEFDWMQAMAVFMPQGDAGSVNKQTLYPVLCVDRGTGH